MLRVSNAIPPQDQEKASAKTEALYIAEAEALRQPNAPQNTDEASVLKWCLEYVHPCGMTECQELVG